MAYDLMIIGGGPAGIAAGIYAARKRLKTVLIAQEIGGQSSVSSSIENWIGIVSVSGSDLGKQLKAHLEHYRGEFLDIVEKAPVASLEKADGGFKAVTAKGEAYEAKAVIIATGSRRRKLAVPGAAEYEHKGIVYCATCDAPMFEGMDVAVVGGGNAGFETANQLLAYAKSITVMETAPAFRAEKITVDRLLADPKVKGVTNASITGISGDKFVSGIAYADQATGEAKTLPVQGVFVEIGAEPATDFAKDLVEIAPFGAIKADPRTQATSVPGIWAAGDCTDCLYHQNNIAAGQGVVAAEDAYNFLQKAKD